MYFKSQTEKQTCRICFARKELGHNFLEWFIFNETLCRNCRQELKGEWIKVKKLGLNIYSYYAYIDHNRQVLLNFKDGKDKWLSDIFMTPFIFKFYLMFYGYKIVYVPSSKSITEIRTYIPNRELLKHLHFTVLDNVLIKKGTYKQSSMPSADKDKIKEHLFLLDKKIIENEKVLIFDDLCTTGNTLKAAYDLIKPHAKCVRLFTLFHHQV